MITFLFFYLMASLFAAERAEFWKSVADLKWCFQRKTNMSLSWIIWYGFPYLASLRLFSAEMWVIFLS